MIFLKLFSDKEQEYELLEDDYESPIPERLRWENWAADEKGSRGTTPRLHRQRPLQDAEGMEVMRTATRATHRQERV